MKRWISGILLCGILLMLLTGCHKGSEEETSSLKTFSWPSGVEEVSSVVSSSEAESNMESADAQQTGGTGGTQGSNSSPGTSHGTSSVTAPVPVKFVVYEGDTFMQVANRLEEKGVCSAADFYQTAQNYTVKSFYVPESSDRCFKMEGYLFPATYDFVKNDDPEDVLRDMLNAYAAYSGMPTDDDLTLASIIEREARSSEHMALVSSVYHNRIAAGMSLDADPTREYVNNYITGNSLVSNQSKYAPLYNTYRFSGLPAGPICNPGNRAIEAAQNPAQTNYYYFFFGMDNTNHYSETYEEHCAQIEKYGVQSQ